MAAWWRESHWSGRKTSLLRARPIVTRGFESGKRSLEPSAVCILSSAMGRHAGKAGDCISPAVRTLNSAMGRPPHDSPREPGALAGAAFLMATSAIGPGFLTQTAVFTEAFRNDFAFAILASLLVDVSAQVNVWRVLGVAGRRGDELASALLPGLGAVLAAMVAAGGLVFNVGNVAGCGLGLAVFGVPPAIGATLSAAASLALLLRPRAGRALDTFAKALGALMIVLTAAVMAVSGPDYLGALRRAVWPQHVAFLPVVTLVGGTVGGYITFSGVHRLLDAGIAGEAEVPRLTRASVLGILVTGAMRVLLFLAVLGVVARAGALDPANPAASAF